MYYSFAMQIFKTLCNIKTLQETLEIVPTQVYTELTKGIQFVLGACSVKYCTTLPLSNQGDARHTLGGFLSRRKTP
jgi:hypothetical protein